MKSIRVGLITTLNTNLGDDFIRDGIVSILRDVVRGRELEFVPVNKHAPATVYPRWHPVQLAGYLPRGRTRADRLARRSFAHLGHSRFDRCDLIVQCGAPVIWPGCSKCEWAEPLWVEVVGRLAERVPVLNLAAGSCFPWERRQEVSVDAQDAAFLRTIAGYCRLTTTRDPIARRVFSEISSDAPLIPCTALLAAPDCPNRAGDGRTILISYMAGGGHYGWDQRIDPDAWESTVRTLATNLSKRQPVAFVCHNEAEYSLARRLAPSIPAYLPRTRQEYLGLAAQCTAAISNRLHASVFLAGLGIPSIAIGTDTRLLMVEALGLPCTYVKNACADTIETQVDELVAKRAEWGEKLMLVRDETRERYIAAVAGALS